MKTTRSILMSVVATVAACTLAAPALASVDGIVSLTPVAEHSCIAVELQTAPGSVIAGIRWYNNDANTTFPYVMLMEGVGNTAPDVAEVSLILQGVAGETLGWGEVELAEPVSTESGILYAMFQLPEDAERTGEGLGGGPGIGYSIAADALPTFISTDGQDWVRLSRDLKLQVELVPGSLARTTVPALSLAEARASRPVGWWDQLATIEEDEDNGALQEKSTPALVHAGRRLAATPNPFNPRTEVHFFLPAPGRVELDVYDVRGRLVSALISGDYPSGAHSVVWDGTDGAHRSVASGVYYLRMHTPAGDSDLRVTLVR